MNYSIIAYVGIRRTVVDKKNDDFNDYLHKTLHTHVRAQTYN